MTPQDWLDAVGSVGLPAVLLVMLGWGFFKSLPRLLEERRKDRREEADARTMERTLIVDGMKIAAGEARAFGERLARAQEDQAASIRAIADTQRDHAVHVQGQLKSLELGLKVQSQQLERVLVAVERSGEE